MTKRLAPIETIEARAITSVLRIVARPFILHAALAIVFAALQV